MRQCLIYCINCGDKYTFYASGPENPNVPREYTDDKYCPGCKKIIYDGLAKVEKLSEVKQVESTELTIDQCFKLYDEYNTRPDPGFFPLMRRVFANLYDPVLDEHTKTNYFECTIDGKKREFIFSYWPSKLPTFRLTTKARVNKEGKIIDYV